LIAHQYQIQVAGQVTYHMVIKELFVIVLQVILTREVLGIQISSAAVLVVQENIVLQLACPLVLLLVRLVLIQQVLQVGAILVHMELLVRHQVHHHAHLALSTHMLMIFGLLSVYNARNSHHLRFQRHHEDVSAKMENTLRNLKAFFNVSHVLWALIALKEVTTSLLNVIPVRLDHILMLQEQQAILHAQSVQQDHHQDLAHIRAFLVMVEKHQFREAFAILARQVLFPSLQTIVRPHQRAFLVQKDILHPTANVHTMRFRIFVDIRRFPVYRVKN